MRAFELLFNSFPAGRFDLKLRACRHFCICCKILLLGLRNVDVIEIVECSVVCSSGSGPSRLLVRFFRLVRGLRGAGTMKPTVF